MGFHLGALCALCSVHRIAGPSQRGSMEYWQIAFDLTDGLSAASIHVRSRSPFSLALSRPSLGKQATVFLQAFKDVCKRLGLWRQTLQLFACTVPVDSTCIVPGDRISGNRHTS